MGKCLQCQKWVDQPKGKKKKDFCNDTCRSNFRYAKNKKSKVKFVSPTPESYNSEKIINITNDEPSQWVEPNTLKTLIELKELCPPELKGLERSSWIAKNRRKYGI